MSLILLFLLGLAIFLVGKLVHLRSHPLNMILVVVGAVIMIGAGLLFVVELLTSAHYDAHEVP